MLSRNDSVVLSNIFDPESEQSAGILIDSALPDDPHITDNGTWIAIKQREKSIIFKVENILKNKEPRSMLEHQAQDMQNLIELHPNCACLLNDYAQILRLMHGDDLINGHCIDLTTKVYQNLSLAITLLTPSIHQAVASPAQCRTLAQAHTQRGALLHGIAKAFENKPGETLTGILADFTTIDLQEAASRDFLMGGRYGNEISKALAVHINPTAKLCGQMVRNAMRQEYASA